jgi:hypothetical protein
MGETIYIIQINMADKGQPEQWDNCFAYTDYNQALAQIEWMKEEYGDQIEYRIDVINFYKDAE